MATTSPVKIPVTADPTRALKAFSAVQRSMAKLAPIAAKTAVRVTKIGVAFGATATAATVALTKMSMSSIDNLAKTADKIGATTESLAGLRHAAEQTGVSSNTLDMAMQRLTRRVSEAASGTGEAKDALIELGLNAQSLEKLPLDTQMEKIATAMGGVESQADRVRLAMKLFDSEGVSLVNTLGLGAEGLQEMAKEAEQLGLAVSRVEAKQIEMANDEVDRAKKVFTGLGTQLASAFSPIIYGIANGFRQSALDAEGFGDIGQRVANAVVGSIGNLLNAVNEIKTAFVTVKSIGLEALLLFQQAKEAIAGPLDRANVEEFNKQKQAIEMLFHTREISEIEMRKRVDELTAAYRRGEIVAKGNKFSEAVAETKQQLLETNQELTRLLNDPPPGDQLITKFKELQAEARRLAEELTGAAGGTPDGDDPNGKKVIERMTFLQEQQIKGKKKLDDFMMKSDTARTAHVIGELNNQFSGIASHNKKLFQINKAFQIAQAIMQTYQGATLALSSYPPPLSFAMAAAQVAAGLGQVAQIKAQSFEGGGFTGMGARAGGIDGKGGFLSVLHPNETVTDHTKGGGAGITIINNVDATGAGSDVDMKIRQAMQQTSEQTIVLVQDLLRRRRMA